MGVSRNDHSSENSAQHDRPDHIQGRHGFLRTQALRLTGSPRNISWIVTGGGARPVSSLDASRNLMPSCRARRNDPAPSQSALAHS
jgi:hypothetical protein